MDTALIVLAAALGAVVLTLTSQAKRDHLKNLARIQRAKEAQNDV